jgi:hypothetical protein
MPFSVITLPQGRGKNITPNSLKTFAISPSGLDLKRIPSQVNLFFLP